MEPPSPWGVGSVGGEPLTLGGASPWNIVIHSDNVLHEMSLPQPEKGVCMQALHDFSWNFFTLDGSIKDLNLGLCPEVTQFSSHYGLQ